MALKAKYEFKGESLLRDARPWTTRTTEFMRQASTATMVFVVSAVVIYTEPMLQPFADIIVLFCLLYFWWLVKRPVILPFKLPKSAKRPDPNYKRPDGSLGMSDGILYLGNEKDTGEEVWFTNSDARTHCLYLGTTGAGKTVGLKAYACNALCWASGFIYIDGKADTSLWSTVSAQVRRFGRDDDILLMNYMTGNASGRVASNTLNPFSSGSASYLTNMLVSLMPDSEGDNAMWKERAVALVSALMPCLVWKRENQNIPLSIGVIRTYLTFKAVIRLSRDTVVPENMRAAVKAYLAELPGYDDRMFDDDGNTKQQPDGSMPDTSTPNQQHGYLSMQFTRSMQSLGDDYGFIFDTQAADVDMLDVVLQRRILIVLIPALEKSSDETANLGKIISSTLKGMMGATLGNTVEGEAATAIENKPTNSATPFIAIFDEVGYYTAQGMAVMAAQARSLGFSLVFAGQDMPALEKRVKEEARSITANCNIKLFGKLEDPTQTKEFFEKTVGTALVSEVSGFARQEGGSKTYHDNPNASVQQRARASYDGLKGFGEGQAICAFGKSVTEMQIYYPDIGDANAMRVHRFLPIPPPAEEALEALRMVDSVLKRLRNPKWKADEAPLPPNKDIEAIVANFSMAKNAKAPLLECGICAVAGVAEAHSAINPRDAELVDGGSSSSGAAPAVPSAAEKAAADAIAKAGAGPLNWMEVVGGATATGAGVAGLRRDPPVVDQTTAVSPVAGGMPAFMMPPVTDAPPAPPKKQGFSWEDIISTAPSTPLPQTPSSDTLPIFTSAGEGKPPATVAEKASGAALGAPISWLDVIGSDDSSLGANAVEDLKTFMASPVAESTSELDKIAALGRKEIGKPMSWSDILGVDDTDNKK